MSIDLASYRPRFIKALDHLQKELDALRTGRASAQILDSVRVEAYGSLMSLAEVASVAVPDPQLIVIKPWDKSLLPAIEKAIQLAQLNLNPIVDKDLIRVPVPTLTTERRQEMVKILHQRAEEGRVMLRQIRADIRKDIEKQEGEAGISEDDLEANFTELDDLVKEYMEKIKELVKSKEKDLLTI
jgi:ribosome recycling factor